MRWVVLAVCLISTSLYCFGGWEARLSGASQQLEGKTHSEKSKGKLKGTPRSEHAGDRLRHTSSAKTTDKVRDLFNPPTLQMFANRQTSDIVLYQCENRPFPSCGETPLLTMSALPHQTSVLNLWYSKLHKYDYYRLQLYFPERHNSWCKILATISLLKLYDYVLYMDSDAVVHTTSSLEVSLDYRKSLSGRLFMNERSRFGDVPNAGVLLFRNSSETTALLKDIWTYPAMHPDAIVDHVHLNQTYTKWPWELHSFVKATMELPDFRKKFHLTSRYTMDHPHGKVIRHFWSKQKRGQMFRHRPPEYLDYIRHRFSRIGQDEIALLTCEVAKKTIYLTYPVASGTGTNEGVSEDAHSKPRRDT
mmetsp:Transcript_31075/g.52203  ORF Transcript_31075/g.52203 Transcript_31075/m.52203 type:complete len:362 (+) Transcript_31075:464-1549(+)